MRRDFATSAHLYAQLLDGPLAVRQAEDAHTLALRTAYALPLYNLADYEAGEIHLRRALGGQERLIGPNDPATLTTLARLADNLGEQGRWSEALALSRDAAERAARLLGTEHESTLGARLTLAWVLLHTQPAEAEPLVRQTARDIDTALGTRHGDIWAIHHLLSETLHALGRWEEAETEARAVIAARQQHQGAAHPYTLRARADLADLALILHSQGRTPEARELIGELAATCGRVLGEEHPCAVRVRANLATIAG
ncbi:tetratricopeptide repeat protein [Streptomyces sp. LBL]|uniref:tetratricopeptide repeat protein n=1 Tax=Streptomyces sp. LBL TaxID=2940562 RepID=UPI002476A9F4|nr:tetratricopeptide repeat protein [Streptomyces sp. LBL]